MPQSPGPSPLAWGDEKTLRTLFPAVASLRTSACVFTHRYSSARAFVDFFRAHFGPAVCAFAALDATGRDRLDKALLDVAQRFNQADDATWLAPMDYIEVAIEC